jgi:hypothetical protein
MAKNIKIRKTFLISPEAIRYLEELKFLTKKSMSSIINRKLLELKKEIELEKNKK